MPRKHVLTNFLFLCVAVLGISACDKAEKIDPLAGGGGLNGQWRSGDNVFIADFSDGAFVSRATDTGEILANGRYIVVSTTEVRLEWSGRLSQQNNTAVCNRQGLDNLNCTDQEGRSFSLAKQQT